MLVKGKIKEVLGPFGSPIREFRQALGLTQEGAARRINVTLGAWRSWESGLNQPRRPQLERIAGLTNNPALRMKFWLDIYQEGIKLGGPEKEKMTPRESLFARYVNDIVMAARELCIAAADGSTTSEAILRHAADELIRAAGDMRRARESGVSSWSKSTPK